MQSKSAALQDQINQLDLQIQQGSSDAQLTLWEMQRKDLNDQLQAALAEEAQQQTATENAGFVFDTLEVDGLTAPEIITDDTQYKLIRKGVQNLVVSLTTTHQKEISDLQAEHRLEMKLLGERAIQAEQANEQLKKDNQTLETTNFQITLDNEALSEKVTKGADLLHEFNQQIEQQKQHIADLQNQIAVGVRGALNVVNMPQDTSALAAEIIASKPRITNVRYKDENGINTRTKLAENVLTGETFEYEAIYEKRYIILDATQSEQYRTEEAAKKAELEAQQAAIPTLAVPEIEPVNTVTETVEAQQDIPFQPEANQVDATEPGLVNSTQTNDGESTEKSEVEPKPLDQQLAQLYEAHTALAARVDNIERIANIQAA